MKTIFSFLLLAFIVSGTSCKKYLDKTPDKKLAVPRTIKDIQALLDNDNLTQTGIGITDLGTDDYFFKDNAELQSNPFPTIRYCYTWEKDIFKGSTSADWINCYQQIYTCNVVLEALHEIEQTTLNQAEWNFAKGHALFCRAIFFYQLAETFGNPFKPASAGTDFGIPLRLKANLEESISRASVQQTFDQIIADLNSAKDLLPTAVDIVHRNRPSKAAVFALLARVYLTMQKYDKAYSNANDCLTIYNTLVDYNTLTIPNTGRTFTPFFPGPNRDFKEIIYQFIQISYGLLSTSTAVDTLLYRSYDNNDLRRTAFFPTLAAKKYFRGQYCGLSNGFCGLATDEVYLIRAETSARMGNTVTAMIDLNTLYEKRWKNTTPFVPLTATDANDALRQIIKERRKELIFRGIRWSDLRRLNQDPQFAVTLVRGGLPNSTTLEPNSPRYVYPIPDDEIQLSGIAQNPR